MKSKRIILFIIILFLLFSLINFSQIQKDANKDDPNINFSPVKFISFRLKNPGVPEIKLWMEKYSDYLYNQAAKRKSGFTYNYSKYLIFEPDTKHLNLILKRIFKKKIKRFPNKASFILASEYKKKKPRGKYIKGLTSEKIASNELRYLKSIYISEKVDNSIESAKKYGISDKILKKFKDLKKEIVDFEKLDIKDLSGCKEFIRKYPKCPYIYLLRREIFGQLYTDLTSINDSSIKDIVYWVPVKKSSAFYNAVYNNILKKTEQGNDIAKTEKILTPWIMCQTYKFNTLEEQIFLVEIYSWLAAIKFQQKEIEIASIYNYTAAAITHSCFRNVKSLYFLFSNKSRQKLQKIYKNIRNTRKLLFTMGKASLYFGRVNFFERISKAIDEKDKKKDESPETEQELSKKLLYKNSTFYTRAVKMLTKLLKIDKDCWPTLYSFEVFPEKDPLEMIILMPRFYDYEIKIEKYINKFKEDSLLIAKNWLKNAVEINKVERAYFILGFFKVKTEITPKTILKENNKYWCYYNIRINHQTPNYKKLLIDVAAKKNKIALILYNRISGKEKTPKQLKTWLFSKIKTKKYKDNEALHIFYKLINNLESEDKLKTIDRMYKSYNMKWADIASRFYSLLIPGKLTEEYIKGIMKGGIPNKKLDLINYIAKKNLKGFSSYVANYLQGQYYRKSDSVLVRKQLSNMYTKDIFVGYNQRINYAGINRAVRKSEKIYKSIYISSASSGLNLLDFNEALTVIKRRFLNDDLLCITGAKWILNNFGARKIEQKPSFDKIKTTSRVQKAVILFLQTYFSEKPDYALYTKKTKKLKKSTKWIQLVTLNARYGDKETVKQETDEETIKNPLKEKDLSTLNSNIKQRFLEIINKARK